MSRGAAAIAIGAGLAVTATGLLWWALSGAQPEHALDQKSEPAQKQQATPVVPAEGSVVPTTELPPAVHLSLPENRTLLLPDGTRIRALNGAINASPMKGAWPKNVPWSPIVATERSDLGVDWYVHEDGSRSTTEMKWRSDLGRKDAVTRLARPAPTPPSVRPPK